MLTIRVTAFYKKDLPKWMSYEIERYQEHGYLIGLVRIKNDDDVRETLCGTWEMRSYWGTPEEVNIQDKISLANEIEKKLYSSEDLRELVSIIWDVFIDSYSDIELFREDVLNALQSPDTIRGLLCVLNSWSDRLYEQAAI